MTGRIAQIPGFIAGTWKLDPAHSDVGFVVGHLVVRKVHGRFDAFSGQSCGRGPRPHVGERVHRGDHHDRPERLRRQLQRAVPLPQSRDAAE
jgi:YceI-like domain